MDNESAEAAIRACGPTGLSLRVIVEQDVFAAGLYLSDDEAEHDEMQIAVAGCGRDGRWTAWPGGGSKGSRDHNLRLRLAIGIGAGSGVSRAKGTAEVHSEVSGRVINPAVAKVEIMFGDGSRDLAKIDNGAYLWFRAEAGHPLRLLGKLPDLPDRLQPTLVVAYDVSGQELQRQELGLHRGLRPRPRFRPLFLRRGSTSKAPLRRVERVGTPRRQPRWLLAAGFVAATAVALLAASLVTDVLTQERSQARSPGPQATAPTGAAAPSGGMPGLTADRKAIAQNGQTVLAIDNDQIVQWFRTESQLCSPYNITTRADRRSFCTDVTAFRDKTRFVAAVSSPDGMSLGFTVESDTLAFMSVAGFYARSSGKVSFLTHYYDGHQFLNFSPSGSRFVYSNICFEANCALYVRDTATLAEVLRVNGPPGDEPGRRNATFLRWLSDSEIEYKLGNEVKRASF